MCNRFSIFRPSRKPKRLHRFPSDCCTPGRRIFPQRATDMKGINASTGHNWRFKDETGKIFGRLTVIKQVGRYKGNALWECACRCGKVAVLSGSQLRNHHTMSCGCLRNEKTSARFKTHGRSKTQEYRVYRLMLERCSRPSSEGYQWYGARGITVCERWRKSFADFSEDMGIRPLGQSIERIDPNGNYEPSNCKWATPFEQGNNKRNTHRLTLDGKTQTISQWALETGINRWTIYCRMRKGWTAKQILTPKYDYSLRRRIRAANGRYAGKSPTGI